VVALSASLKQDTVAVAHGGTARALMVVLGLAPSATAPLIEVQQGVVYAFEADRVMIYR
jgi:broad specificity phosphatase PhoE